MSKAYKPQKNEYLTIIKLTLKVSQINSFWPEFRIYKAKFENHYEKLIRT